MVAQRDSVSCLRLRKELHQVEYLYKCGEDQLVWLLLVRELRRVDEKGWLLPLTKEF